MHYGAFRYGTQVITPKNGVNPQDIGQRNGLSIRDIASVQAIYGKVKIKHFNNDFNGDGKTDIATWSSDGIIRLGIQQGTTTVWTETQTSWPWIPGSNNIWIFI